MKASKLKHFKTGKYDYLYVYYRSTNSLIRINTKLPFKEGFHNKDLTYSKKELKYQIYNQQLKNLQNSVDTYIIRCELDNLIPTQSGYRNYKKTGEIFTTQKKPDKNKSILELLNDFINEKKVELNNRQSYKDYISLKNSIIDFSKNINKKLDFNIITKNLIYQYRNFLSEKHPEYKTKGNMNDNTINKRISSLKGFLKWVEKKGLYQFNDDVYEIRIKKYRPKKIALTRDEIKMLENIHPDKENWQKILDVFIISCFMGLRYSDLVTFSKGEFVEKNGNLHYTKWNEKTETEIDIVITPTAKKLLKKYDYDLPIFTNQYYDRMLKEIFKHYGLFQEKIKITKKSNGKITTEMIEKYKLIGSHTARRTFITMLINHNVPLNTIMRATGHKKLETLMLYIKETDNDSQFLTID